MTRFFGVGTGCDMDDLSISGEYLKHTFYSELIHMLRVTVAYPSHRNRDQHSASRCYFGPKLIHKFLILRDVFKDLDRHHHLDRVIRNLFQACMEFEGVFHLFRDEFHITAQSPSKIKY